jgi:hypothetical protein
VRESLGLSLNLQKLEGNIADAFHVERSPCPCVNTYTAPRSTTPLTSNPAHMPTPTKLTHMRTKISFCQYLPCDGISTCRKEPVCQLARKFLVICTAKCPRVGGKWQEEQRTVLLEKIAEMVAEQLKRHTHVPHVIKFAQQLCATIRSQTNDVGGSGHNNLSLTLFHVSHIAPAFGLSPVLHELAKGT